MSEHGDTSALNTPDGQVVKEEIDLDKVPDETLKMSQDVDLSAASEETHGTEEAELEDGQTVRPPEVTCTETKWTVGAQGQVAWSEDGQVYPATVVSLDGERCKVRFNDFGNEEEVELSALKSPDAAVQTQKPDSQDWRPGSRCRAVYSGDGLVYPAVVKWVKGQRCCVRYDEYNNEEEHDVGDLLSVNELYGPNRARGGRRTMAPSRREEKAGERGAERRSAWRDDQHISSWIKEKFGHQSKAEKEEKKKYAGEKATNHSFSLFPPFPPQTSSGDSSSFVPPPPPPWPFAGKESSGADSASSLLMLWYMCGFHTGSYLTQQAFRSSSKD